MAETDAGKTAATVDSIETNKTKAEVPSEKENDRTVRRLTRNVTFVSLLALCLLIATAALALTSVEVRDNRFHTGIVKINLNDGKPVIREDEFLFEPGMTVEKTFFVENDSTWAVYCRLYFGEVSGDLADVVQITFLDGDETIATGTARELSRSRAAQLMDELAVGERKELTVLFHYPEEAGNATQMQSLSFRLMADAVQTKNNPSREF